MMGLRLCVLLMDDRIYDRCLVGQIEAICFDADQSARRQGIPWGVTLVVVEVPSSWWTVTE
jgi:hypothetical protein